MPETLEIFRPFLRFCRNFTLNFQNDNSLKVRWPGSYSVGLGPTLYDARKSSVRRHEAPTRPSPCRANSQALPVTKGAGLSAREFR